MKQMKKLLSVLLAVLMVFSLMSTALAAKADESLAGKIVILHSNDVHGAVEGYAKIAALRDEYVKAGAEVILADAGDFCQGTPYVSLSKGKAAVEMMNAVGYDVSTLGNHEFDFGYENLTTILKDAKFKVVCGDVLKDGAPIWDGWTILEKKGVKIGFVGLETPETYTKVNPGLIQGLSFPQTEELYACAQKLVDEVKAAGADIVVGLFHLGVDDESIGNRSADVYAKVTGLDFVIDGHAHFAMVPGAEKTWAELKKNNDTGEMEDVFHTNPCKDQPIQSTGTKFNNVGVIVIDPAAKEVSTSYLVRASEIAVPEDSAVLAKAKDLIKDVDEQYGAVFAKSEVELNGDKAPNGNRDSETNLGDLITDAMVWSVLKDTDLKVPYQNVVGITNGGGIRAWIHKGDVTMKDINTVLPFGNTVTVVYVTGAELLEALEASCYMLPGAVGGFPQVSGMNIAISTDKAFDQGEQYPNSTYHAPKSIQRVKILDVNGAAFSTDATYAVVTNDFASAGGDTYYAFKAASDQFDTSIPMDQALMDYVKEVLNGVIGEPYSEPMGRIFIGTEDEVQRHMVDLAVFSLLNELMPRNCYTPESVKPMDDALAAYDQAETLEAAKEAFSAMIEAREKLVVKDNTFSDVPEDAWYDPAVDFVAAPDLMKGTGNNKFEPEKGMTRAMVATVLYRCAGEPDVEGLECPFTDLTQDWYKNAVIWASACGITNGKTATTFCPDDPITREQMATMISRYVFGSEKHTAEEIAAQRTFLNEAFADGAKISDYAVFPVDQMNNMKVMQGDKAEAGKLPNYRPGDTMSRAECAQVLLNLYKADPGLIYFPVQPEAEALRFAA